MPSFRRRAWILSASVLALSACKSELDNKPAADPLEDPWVDAIDTGDDEPALAAAPTPATVVEAPAEPALDPSAVAMVPAEAGDPAAPEQPATGVIASPTPGSSGTPTSTATKPGSTAQPGAPTEQPVGEPTEQPADAPAPVAEPTPTPTTPTAEPAQPASQPALTIADLHGNYKFVGGSSQRADLEAAIEAAAESLPMAIRGIGRKRLTKTNPIDSTLDIVITGDKVQTIFETGFDASCQIDGATVHWTSKKGDQYKVRVRSKGTKLVQIIEGEDGVKTTVFVLSADKQKLTVHHKITSDRLDEPMTYRLSYSRK